MSIKTESMTWATPFCKRTSGRTTCADVPLAPETKSPVSLRLNERVSPAALVAVEPLARRGEYRTDPFTYRRKVSSLCSYPRLRSWTLSAKVYFNQILLRGHLTSSDGVKSINGVPNSGRDTYIVPS